MSVWRLYHFLRFFKRFIIPIYKGQESHRVIAKRFIREKIGNYVGLRITKFSSEMVKNWRKEKS